ncbi:hypothetical protein [Actinomadura sp. WMMA1423]|uniref:hypothetical protein n=1 Tax=Actinomadura sp. WMMA1423 TaxID=2591108 RepID=UPI001146A3E7|nr:hypothetical protein [Actinomadura sp. WMMA1423]
MRRAMRGWWLLMAAAAAGAVASLLASSLPALAGSALVALTSAVAGTLTVRAERSIDRRSPLEPAHERRGPVRRVRDLDDPLAVGVHPAFTLVTDTGEIDRCPPFIRRERSGELEDALRFTGFVLVVGESTAGKTRAAYEAMRTCLPDHVFVRPPTRDDLPSALASAARHGKSVLWLDDLELYLGAKGLTAEMVSSLLATPGGHRIVLATMRSHERARYSSRLVRPEGDEEQHSLRQAAGVLDLAREIRIERLWSTGDRREAANEAHDRRIAKALEQAEHFGVAQYLAAGPELFREWQDARGSWPEGRPRAAALVTAAVDVRRAGYHLPLPVAFLQSMHQSYLEGAARFHLRLESWEQALEWATEPLHTTSSLLVPAPDDHYVAFDYLADAADDTPSFPDVPPHAWQAVVAFVPPADAINVAWSAFLRHRLDVAEQALTKAFVGGHYEAAHDFSLMMRETARDEDVVSWLERAVRAASRAGAPPEKIIRLRAQIAWWVGRRYENHGDVQAAYELAEAVVADSTRILGAEHPLTLDSRIMFIRQLGDVRSPGEALAMAREVADTAARVHGTGHWVYRNARFEVAVWTLYCGDRRRAVRCWRDLVEDSLTEEPETVEDSLRNITAVLMRFDDPALTAEAVRWLEALTDGAQRNDDVDHQTRILLLTMLAAWTGREGDHSRARDIARRAMEDSEKALGALHLRTIDAKLALAHEEGELGDVPRARALAEEAEEVAARVYGESHRMTVWAREEVHQWTPDPRPSEGRSAD